MTAETDLADACLWCGAPLPERRHWARLWCGERCKRSAFSWRRKAGRWGETEEIADCDWCGERFERARPFQRFCSKRCGVLYWHREYAEALLPRACEVCGREFVPKARRGARCCSNTCIATRRRQRLGAGARKPVDYPPRACAVCGAEYKPRQHNSRTCSADCARAWRNR